MSEFIGTKLTMNLGRLRVMPSGPTALISVM